MKPYFEGDAVQLYLGDMCEVLPTLPAESVDAIVCDPPYEISFMSRAWDATGIAYDVDVWLACWRVLKPGGHLLAFGGTRTYHRMACAIEDAGFQIRDSIHWMYGSGMPKGQNIGKSIDRKRDDRTDVLKVTAWLSAARSAAGMTNREIDEAFGFNGMSNHWTGQSVAAVVPSPEHWDRLRDLLGFDDTEILPLVNELNGRKGLLGEAWAQREVIGHGHRVRRESNVQIAPLSEGGFALTSPATDAARTWQGWNTQLKPAHEPIVVARKSTGFNSTVANVLKHGTGALNIDACRTAAASDLGRWPTNVVFSHLPECGPDDSTPCGAGCAVVDLDQQSGATTSRTGGRSTKALGIMNDDSWAARDLPRRGHADTGGASRFFPAFRYEAKAPASERPRIPVKAMRLRADLTDEQRAFVMAELKKAGVDVA